MSWWSRLFNHFRSNDLSRDIGREIRFHLDERADELIRLGMRPADAHREARRRFGSVALQSEHTRDRDIFRSLDTLSRDIRYALRSIRATPVFTIVAILSLALGIGANTAIFTVIDAVMLKSLPVQHPEELLMVLRDNDDYFTNPLWEAIRDRQDVFSGAFAFGETTFDLANGGESRPVYASWVTGEYFTTLGVRAEVGRTIVKADDYRGCPGIAVLGDAFWKSEYGGDQNAVGKTISFNGHPFRIVGVTGPRFFGPSVGQRPQVFVPLCAEPIIRGAGSQLDKRSSWYLQVVGRPKPGLSTQQIAARLSSLSRGIADATLPDHWPSDAKAHYLSTVLKVAPAEKGFSDLRSTYKKALYVLMVIVGLVLAVACANVANLLLARAAVRQREMAVRLALGASRGRLARQLITESLLLSCTGAALGALFSVMGSRMLVNLLSRSNEPSVVLDLHPDPIVLGFTIAIAVATGLLFGLVPAWRAGRVDPQAAMKAQARGVAHGQSRFGTAKALVVAQVALSLVLIAGAGLLIGSWRRLETLDPGFRRDGIVLVNANIHEAGVAEKERATFFNGILDRLRTIPGVSSASVSALIPVGNMQWNEELKVDGFTPSSGDDALAWMNAVSPGYFATLGIPVKQGRDIASTDGDGSPRVAVVSETMARHFFGTPSAVGRTFRIQEGSDWSAPIEVVGVVGDTKYASLREATKPVAYFSGRQSETGGEQRVFELRTGLATATLLPSVRTIFAEFNPKISLDVNTLSQQLDNSTTLARAIAMLSGFFGGLALVLATIGLYGVMSYNVARRRNEIGVRIALGAERSRVIRMVLAEVGRLVTLGVVIGLLLSALTTRLVKAFLYGVEPSDPRTLTVSAAILLAVGLCAATIPARRAARLNPVSALRED